MIITDSVLEQILLRITSPQLLDHGNGLGTCDTFHLMDAPALNYLKDKFNLWTFSGTANKFELKDIPMRHFDTLKEWLKREIPGDVYMHGLYVDSDGSLEFRMVVQCMHSTNYGTTTYYYDDLRGEIVGIDD